MSGPRVEPPIDMTTWSSSLGAIDDLNGLARDFASGSWISGGLNAASLVGDTSAFVMDPIGTIISWGAAWLLDHLEPLKGWLNDLTGDAPEVRAIGATWGNIGEYLNECASDIASKVVAMSAEMSGLTIEQYQAAQKLLTDGLTSLGSAASGFGTAVSVAAELVQIVHDVVRDALSEIVGTLGSAILEAVASCGVLIPKVICEVSNKVATWGAMMGKKIDDLISSFEALKKLLNTLDDIVSSMKSAMREKFPNEHMWEASCAGTPTTQYERLALHYPRFDESTATWSVNPAPGSNATSHMLTAVGPGTATPDVGMPLDTASSVNVPYSVPHETNMHAGGLEDPFGGLGVTRGKNPVSEWTGEFSSRQAYITEHDATGSWSLDAIFDPKVGAFRKY